MKLRERLHEWRVRRAKLNLAEARHQDHLWGSGNSLSSPKEESYYSSRIKHAEDKLIKLGEEV